MMAFPEAFDERDDCDIRVVWIYPWSSDRHGDARAQTVLNRAEMLFFSLCDSLSISFARMC
jgi:hypothetical protein